MNLADLTELIVEQRRHHRFFRAHPDPSKRPEFMQCACGIAITVRSEDPWDDFERHRADAIVAAMIRAEIGDRSTSFADVVKSRQEDRDADRD